MDRQDFGVPRGQLGTRRRHLNGPNREGKAYR